MLNNLFSQVFRYFYIIFIYRSIFSQSLVKFTFVWIFYAASFSLCLMYFMTKVPELRDLSDFKTTFGIVKYIDKKELLLNTQNQTFKFIGYDLDKCLKVLDKDVEVYYSIANGVSRVFQIQTKDEICLKYDYNEFKEKINKLKLFHEVFGISSLVCLFCVFVINFRGRSPQKKESNV